MKITVVNARDLPSSSWERWQTFQEENADLASPYFCAEFTRRVAAIRKDVFVAVLGSPKDPSGFFPFQRRRLGFAEPVGTRLSDFHGMIASRDLVWDVPELMRECGLTSWEFHALVGSQSPFAPYHAGVRDSHYLECATGLQGYEERRRLAGASSHKQVRATRRKAEERFRSVEFLPHVTDLRVLEALLEWKSRQHRENGTVDNWSFDWMRALLHGIHAHQGEDFAGALSALYFDGELAAVHMGMRSRTVWHWWISRYEEKFGEFRPGLLLLYRMIEHAPQLGIKRIDLGYGDEEYKRRLRSGSIPVAHGRVELPSLGVSLRRWRAGLESWVRRSPLLPIARYPGRLIRRLELWNRFR
jgi:CelD/BcsL family acetyltransferase involved in cellulose biosynthesis